MPLSTGVRYTSRNLDLWLQLEVVGRHPGTCATSPATAAGFSRIVLGSLTMRAATIAILVAGAAAACGSAKPLNISSPTAMPPGVVGKPFGPPALGVSMTVPATWRDAAPAAGFQYRLIDANPSNMYLLADSKKVGGLSIGRFASLRATFLRSIGGKIASKRAALIDRHGAAVLRYRLPVPGQPGTYVEVTEYDIAHGQSIATVALGLPATTNDSGLFRWIASTIRVSAD